MSCKILNRTFQVSRARNHAEFAQFRASSTRSPLGFKSYKDSPLNQKAQLLAEAGLALRGLKDAREFWEQRRTEAFEEFGIPKIC